MSDDYFITCRSLNSDGTFGGGTGQVRYLVIPDTDDVPLAKHENPNSGPIATRGTRWARQLLTVVPPAQAEAHVVAGKPMRNLLFVVHGFNVRPKGALSSHRQVVAGLARAGWRGQVVSFDWPSAGLTAAYIPDRIEARNTANLLVQSAIRLFVTVSTAQNATNDCDVAVHLLAHSMGAYVTREAFNHADDDNPTRGQTWQVNQLAFISGDIAAASMSAGNALSRGLYGHAGRVTNYQNPFDGALQISNAKRAFAAPRVGRVGLPDDSPDLACNVDCGAVWQPLAKGDPSDIAASHCFWFTSDVFYADLKLTLDGDIDRDAMPTRTLIRPNRTALRPA